MASRLAITGKARRLAALLCLTAGCGRGPGPNPTTAPGTPGPGAGGQGAAAAPADRDAVAPASDPLGESAARVVYLEQNWSPEDSLRFYNTSQGSQILPHDWFLVLEQADNTRRFREDANILRYRYLPQKPDTRNPYGLPVGFVKDDGKDRAWLGFNCAACHTGEVHYNGVAYRVDGAPATGDVTGLLRGITAALKATAADPDKFDRFAKNVLGDRDGPVARQALKAQVAKVIERRDGYDTRNFPDGKPAGYARIDAFGAILNEVMHHAVRAKDLASNTTNTQPADAPVSIPFLWDTPQHDLLQWNGSAENKPLHVGALGRNVGEVLGVFADFDIPEAPGPFGYPSSVKVANLLSMEEWVTTLWSPLWPADFPPIDATKRDRGRVIYQRDCVRCHHDIDRKDPRRKVAAVMTSTGTDPRMATNFTTRVGRAGKLEGAFSLYFPLVGTPIPADAPGGAMLKNVVIGTIIGSAFHPPADELSQIQLVRPVSFSGIAAMAMRDVGPKYKARPLNGIWATAPYLHNGSVPSLDALLRPPGDRPKSFTVGSRVFRPDVVGFQQDAKGVSTFRVVDDSGKEVPGNSNSGHVYGTALGDGDRADLLEYLKSL